MGYSDVQHDRNRARRPPKLWHEEHEIYEIRDDVTYTNTSLLPEFLEYLRLSTLFDDIGESIPMSPEVYDAIREGNKKSLQGVTLGDIYWARLITDQGNSILHLAAALGRVDLVKLFISTYPVLLLKPNFRNDLPLHVAAGAGHLAVVKILVMSIRYISTIDLSCAYVDNNIYTFKNRDGDTALHAALRGKHTKVAYCLVNVNRRVSFLVNNDGISPLYLAVEAGYVKIIKAMVKRLMDYAGQSSISNLELQLEGKSIVHATLKAKRTDILDAILNEYPIFSSLKDEEGRTCLSFAASIGYYEGTRYLLRKSTSGTYVSDDDGSYPVHVAAKKGHISILKEFLGRCPKSRDLVNKQGQNILHVAAQSGKAEVVKYILKLDEKGKLINEQDGDGKTPLDLATQYQHPQVVSMLIEKDKVNLARAIIVSQPWSSTRKILAVATSSARGCFGWS